MAWIKSFQELGEHPKTKRAARLLGICCPQLVGHLHYLWWWAESYAEDGNLAGYTADDINDAAMWEGDPDELINALLNSGVNGKPGFLERDEDGELWIHDWVEYAGRLLARRETERERQRQRRHSVGATLQQHTQDVGATYAGRVEKSREEKNREDTGASAPVPISNATIVKGQVAEVWDYYKEHISPLARICPESKVKTRLGTYSVADLKRAVDCFCAHWWWYTHNKGQGGEWFFRSDGQIDRFLLLVPETQEQCEARNRPSANGRQQSDPVRKSAPRLVVPATMRGGAS